MSRFSTTLLPVRPKTKNRTPAFNRPFAFDDFRSDLENMFQRFWTGWMPFTKDYGNYNWDFDTTEYEKEYVVKAELPGFEENQISLKFEDGILSLEGERKFEKENGDENYHRVERSYGKFVRSFTIPTNVDHEKIAASFHNGVLTVELPKREETKPKAIKIQPAKSPARLQEPLRP